jgi:hypothetical protein
MPAKKGAKTASDTERMERRAAVLERHLARMTVRQIAAELKMPPSSVHNDIQRVREEWRERASDAVDMVTGEVVAHLWENYRVLLAAFESSKTTIRTEADIKIRKGKRSIVGERVVKQVSAGNPAYISEANAILDKIGRIYGIFKPTKVSATTPDGTGSAPLSAPQQQTNYVFLDLQKDPAAMTPEELEMTWKLLDQKSLQIDDPAATIEGSASSSDTPPTIQSESTPNAAGESKTS